MKNTFSIILLIILVLNFSILIAQNDVEIKTSEGIPSLFINGEQYPPFAYMSYFGEKEYYSEIAEAGIHLYCFPAYLGDRGINTASGIGLFRSAVWTGENQYDFSSIEVDFKKIIEADPLAKVIIRFYLDPPEWWEKLNPDASCQLADGSTFRQCFSSGKWRKETGETLEDCLEWLQNSSYANHLIGIHVAAGGTEEWFYHAQQRDDHNPVRVNAFREWLRSKYRNNRSLQEAWNNKLVTLNSARPAKIYTEKSECWRDIVAEQNIIDTYKFHSETIVENIEYFCRIIKKKSSRKLLTGAFYGYHYYVTDPGAGHGALSELLQCKDLDYLSSPNVYNRVIGEDWPPMVAIQSVQLHGKLWLAENDTRTSITTLLKDRASGVAPAGQYESGVWLGPKDMDTSVSFLWKNAGRMLTQGYGGWWFDMWGGWFSDFRLLNVIGETKNFYTQFSPKEAKQMKPQVCVFVDEEISFYDATYGKLTEKILSNRYPLAKTGAPYDLFLRSDIERIQEDHYKVIWFMGFIKLTQKERNKIKDWQKQGITVMCTDGKSTHLYKAGEESQLISRTKWTDLQLNNIWENAGVHIYTSPGDVFYIGRNWLCVHSVEGGEKTVRFPFPTQVLNPGKKDIISDYSLSYVFQMSPGTTRLFRLNPINS